MSGKVVGWAFAQVVGKIPAKLLLVKLADHANEDGICWPSIDLMVRDTEMGRSTAYKHLALLDDLPRQSEIFFERISKTGLRKWLTAVPTT